MARVYDSCSDTNAKLLHLHQPDVGDALSWVKMNFDIYGGGAPGDLEIFNSPGAPGSPPPEWRNNVIGAAFAYIYQAAVCRNSTAPDSADYDVYAAFKCYDSSFLVAGTDGAAVLGRMSATGTTNGVVDRYTAAATWNGTRFVFYLYKTIAGVTTSLGTAYTGFPPGQLYGWIRLEMKGSAIKVYESANLSTFPPTSWTEAISVTDTSIASVGRGGVWVSWDHGSPSGEGKFRAFPQTSDSWQYSVLMDNIYIDANWTLKLASDLLGAGITESAGPGAVDAIEPSDTLGVTITESTGDVDIIVLKEPSDTLGLALSGVADTPSKYASMFVRAGLITDIEPHLLLTHWDAGEWIALGQLLIPKSSGTTVDWMYSGFSTGMGLDVTSLTPAEFDPLLAAHPGSMFVSPKEQRGSFRFFATASGPDGDVGILRGTVRVPSTSYALTQDPVGLNSDNSRGVSRVPLGLFSWPPAPGGAKYRSSNISQGGSTDDPLDLTLIQVEGLTEFSGAPALANIRLNAIDLLPVSDGHFSMVPNRNSEQTALQPGEILVVDSIDFPSGSYVLKATEKPETFQENLHMPSSSLTPVLGSGIQLRPREANYLTFLVDFWSSVDDLGLNTDASVFNAWVEYEPHYLYV